MEKVVILDTSMGSTNRGDEIIMSSAKKVIKKVTEGKFVISVPTHSPVFNWYQSTNYNSRAKLVKETDLKFVCGTNLLYTNMLKPWPGWNINIFNSAPLKDSILLGVGSSTRSKKMNFYTKKLYKSVLSNDYVHSVRDNKAKKMLEEIGLKAINTGCPTLWSLTPEFCNEIETSKSDSVVFTLTDYAKDINNDQKLIDILNKNYKDIYFWPQGPGDYDYFSKLNNVREIKVIQPNVEDYSNLLKTTDIDYIGTRLHGGIFAMKHKKRSIILIVDDRAREMEKSYSLNFLERQNIDDINNIINSELITKPEINFDSINKWLDQF